MIRLTVIVKTMQEFSLYYCYHDDRSHEDIAVISMTWHKWYHLIDITSDDVNSYSQIYDD
jgi:hypothetical protein